MHTVVDPEIVFSYLKAQLNLHRSDDFRGVLFLNDNNQPGVCYGWHGFIGRMCVINIVVADKTMLSRRIVKEAFRFPFEVCGVNAVLAFVDTVNTGSVELCTRSGFKPKYTIPNGGLEGDLIVFEMLKDDCIWFKGKK